MQAKTNQKELSDAKGNYWIRTRVASGCGNIEHDDETTGILVYNGFAPTTPSTHTQQFRTLCEDEPRASLNPVVPWQPRPRDIKNDIAEYTFEAGISPPSNNLTDSGYARWDLTNKPLFLNYSDPSIVHTDNLGFNFSNNYAIVDCMYLL